MPSKKIFVSHCTKNKEIADHLIDLLEQTGVPRASVFCTSIVGQGIRNGQELNSRILLELQEAAAIIFLISYDFLQSAYCVEELGVGWFLSQKGDTKCFYLVLPDISIGKIEGFVNSKIQKLTVVNPANSGDFSLFLEDFHEKIGISLPNHMQTEKSERAFFKLISPHISSVVAREKRRTETPKKQKSRIKELEEENRELKEEIRRLRGKKEGPNPPDLSPA